MHGNFGKKHPELTIRNKSKEQIEKVRTALTGRRKTAEHKLALSRACKGRIITPETRIKISQSSRGHKKSLDTRRRQSLGKRGEQCWNWKGGVSSINERIRASFEYRVWRESIFARDNFTCQECSRRGGKLQADHIKPFAFFPELRFELSNGRTLCVDCHRKTPTWGNNKNIYELVN